MYFQPVGEFLASKDFCVARVEGEDVAGEVSFFDF